MGPVLGSLDPAKVLVILVVALIVLGPERLPRAARQLGAAWRELTRIREQVREEVQSAIPQIDIPRIPQGAVSGFIRDLTSTVGTTVEVEHDAPGVPAGQLVPTESLDHSAAAPSGASADGQAGGASAEVAMIDDPGMN